MVLHVDDDGFVRAPAGAVYPVLTDIGRWGAFWPGTTVTATGDDRFALEVRGLRPLRLEVTAHGWRHDQGVRLTLGGDLTGEAEFWLDPGWGGTVVHHLCTASSSAGRGTRTHQAYRRWVRRGLWGLRDHVHEAAPAVRGRDA